MGKEREIMKTYVIELVRVYEITSDKELDWQDVIYQDEKLYYTSDIGGLDSVMLVSNDISVIDIVDELKGDD
jgi:hypothetical protein